jgi:hypothetical protein
MTSDILLLPSLEENDAARLHLPPLVFRPSAGQMDWRNCTPTFALSSGCTAVDSSDDDDEKRRFKHRINTTHQKTLASALVLYPVSLPRFFSVSSAQKTAHPTYPMRPTICHKSSKQFCRVIIPSGSVAGFTRGCARPPLKGAGFYFGSLVDVNHTYLMACAVSEADNGATTLLSNQTLTWLSVLFSSRLNAHSTSLLLASSHKKRLRISLSCCKFAPVKSESGRSHTLALVLNKVFIVALPNALTILRPGSSFHGELPHDTYLGLY